MNEIAQNKNIILFIDELHTLVGAGAAEGAIDASQHAQARARARRAAVRRRVDAQRVPQVHREGRRARAPLPDGDRRSALGRRDGRDPEGAAQEVRGSPPGRRSPTRRCVAAAKLSERYITDRFLPDKAIDVIDEAGARARLAAQVPPPEVAALKDRAREGERARRKPRSATRTSSARPRCATRSASSRARSGKKQEEWEKRAPVAPPGARRGGDRVHRQPLDGHSGDASAGGGDRAPAAHGGRAARSRSSAQDEAIKAHRALDPPQPRRAQGSEPSDRLVHLLAARRASGRRSWRARWRSSCSPTRRR